MTSSAPSLTAQLADLAATSIANAVETFYTHTIEIDDNAGIYKCDCSAFAQHLLQRVAPDDLRTLRETTHRTVKRPLARDFYTFFAGLPVELDESAGEVGEGWRQISTLVEARRGDILAWILPNSPPGKDTGHVVILSDAPTLLPLSSPENTSDNPSADATDALGPIYAVPVYDASEIKHFDDSRGSGHDYKTGIGAGTIHVDVDATGKPVGFQFNEATQHYVVSISVGRMLG